VDSFSIIDREVRKTQGKSAKLSKQFLQALQRNLRQALNQNHADEAAEILDRLKKEDPLSLETRGFELEFYLKSNRLSEAESLARQLCHLFPQSARIFLLAGKVAYRQKRYLEAEARFRESHRIFPHWRTAHWLGKTLTQSGKLEEAEPLLVGVVEHSGNARLDLAWLYERRNDFDGALKQYDAFLEHNPAHTFAIEQQKRLKAKILDPDALIEEVDALAEWGEQIPDALFSELVEKLFQTGDSLRARAEITARLGKFDTRLGVRVAWVCHKYQAYDLALSLFQVFLPANLSNYKYLRALESAAARCHRVPQVIEAYRALAGQAPHLHGRIKSLARRGPREA
jgi:tetratricopeptide (TPR) repeat protein